MKNLKRALSLVLSTAMLLGMMVVGTGASYDDVTSEHYVEAIEVMEAAGIMEGDGNGFNPDNKVTRHEMAVVMANMLALDIDTFKGASLPFTDVADWAAPYVAACYADGIMAGTSATTFGGTINVTAAQAALMMMKALGYFQNQPDFGEDWQLATIKQASKIDLFDGMKVGTTTELTRNDVAKLALNALKSDVVDFTGEYGMEITMADGSSIIAGYVSDYSALIDTEGYNYNGAAITAYDYEILQLVEKLYEDDLTVRGDSDDFGRPTSIWKYKVNDIGEYATKPDFVFENKLTKSALYSAFGKTLVNDIQDSDATNPSDMSVYSDGKLIETIDGTDVTAYYFDKKSTGSIEDTSANALTGNGTVTEAYIDSKDNSVVLVIINPYLVKAQADYSAKKEYVTVDFADEAQTKALYTANLSSEDFDVEDVLENDYLLVTMASVNNTNNYDVKSVEAAEVVSGVVNAYTTGTVKNVTIDGTKYSFAKTGDVSEVTNFVVGENATIVTDGAYAYFVDEATVAADKYVYIKQVKSDGFSDATEYTANAIFVDGTKKVIDLKNKYFDASGVKQNTTTGLSGWFAYSVSEDVYTLRTIAAAETKTVKAADISVTGDNTAAVVASDILFKTGAYNMYNNTTITFNNDTIFVVEDADNEVVAYTGVGAAPSIIAKDANVITAKIVCGTKEVAGSRVTNNTAKFVYIDADGAKIDGGKKGGDFIYLLKNDGNYYDNVDGKYYVIYKALVNGEETVINVSEDFSAAINVVYTDVKYNESGYVTDMNVVDSNDDYTQIGTALTNAEVGFSGGVLSLGSTKFVVAEDCEIYLNISANVTLLLDDEAANFELYNGITATALKNTLKGTQITGTYYAAQDDDTQALTALYIDVNSAALVP